LRLSGIGNDEEFRLCHHLLAAHPQTVQPETRSVLLRHFVVTEGPLACNQKRMREGYRFPATHVGLAPPKAG